MEIDWNWDPETKTFTKNLNGEEFKVQTVEKDPEILYKIIKSGSEVGFVRFWEDPRRFEIRKSRRELVGVVFPNSHPRWVVRDGMGKEIDSLLGIDDKTSIPLAIDRLYKYF